MSTIKNNQRIATEYFNSCRELYTVDVFGSRAVPKADLADMAKKYIADSTAAESLESAIETAIKNGENLLVFGSLYLASDARKIIINLI